MSNLNEILIKIRNIKPQLIKKYKIGKIGVFGSYVRNEQTSDSDVDILVEFSEPIGLDFVNLAEELESELKEIVRPLSPGSVFLFYTDGLTEAMNGKGVQFGEEAVSDVVKTRRNLPASALQQMILTAVEEFRGPAEQHDDLTMVLVKGISRRKKPR